VIHCNNGYKTEKKRAQFEKKSLVRKNILMSGKKKPSGERKEKEKENS